MSNSSSGPKKRPSKAVYRRRRLVAFLLLVALVVFVIILISRCSSTPAPVPTPTRSASVPTSSLIPLVSPTAAPTSGAAGQYVGDAKECSPANLVVGAYTDKTDYASGEVPQLTMSVTNKGTVDCKVNVGTSQQVYQITSGNDIWWQSTDCQTESSDYWILLTAGQTEKTGAAVPWVRERSSPDTCNAERQAAIGGGASYYLTTTLGDVQSKESTQFLLY